MVVATEKSTGAHAGAELAEFAAGTVETQAWIRLKPEQTTEQMIEHLTECFEANLRSGALIHKLRMYSTARLSFLAGSDGLPGLLICGVPAEHVPDQVGSAFSAPPNAARGWIPAAETKPAAAKTG